MCELTCGMCYVQVLKWSDYCLPLACSPGQPFRVVAQTTVDNFCQLGVAFLEGCLQLDNGLLPSKIVRMLPLIILQICTFYNLSNFLNALEYIICALISCNIHII